MTDDKKRKAEEAAADKQQLQERILRGVRPDTSEATGKWVVDLKSGGTTGEVDVPLQFDEKTAGKYPDDMRSWVDKMFDEFQRYLAEYNKHQTMPDMVINTERPVFQKASTTGLRKYGTSKETPTFFQGHLYSNRWALLVRGEELMVKAWVLPVDFLIGFDTKEEDFKPYFVMKAARNDRGICIWHVDAVPISYEAINAITKSMFSALVRACREEFKEGEQFRLASEEVQEQSKMDTEQFIQRYTIPPGSLNARSLQGAVQPGPAANPQPNFPGFSTPMVSAQMPQVPQSPFQQPNFQRPAPSPPFQTPQFGQPQPQPQPQPQQQPPAPPVPSAPMPSPNAPFPAPSSPRPAPMPNVAPTPAGGSSDQHDMLFQALEENYKAILSASQTASHTMTGQLDLLTKIGMAAMQAANMEGVSQVVNRSKAVKAIRDKIDAFIEELNAIKSSK